MKSHCASITMIALCFAIGCGQPAQTTTPPTAVTPAVSQERHVGHDHSGWWCPEHGVPEEICGRCDSKLAAQFQKDGDWCKEHDRPDSQCFVCHPELEAKFAAQYEAKFGKQPPKPEG